MCFFSCSFSLPVPYHSIPCLQAVSASSDLGERKLSNPPNLLPLLSDRNPACFQQRCLEAASSPWVSPAGGGGMGWVGLFQGIDGTSWEDHDTWAQARSQKTSAITCLVLLFLEASLSIGKKKQKKPQKTYHLLTLYFIYKISLCFPYLTQCFAACKAFFSSDFYCILLRENGIGFISILCVGSH